VAKQSSTDDVHGHWVEDGSATRDHFLVDKQDFNAPISYTFASNKRMWYQRTPENYAGQKTVTDPVSGKKTTVTDRSAGWEGISLPFSAELVTTHQKGEITHFYDGSETSKNGTSTKTSHEYWLRRLDQTDDSKKQMKLKDGSTKDLIANFTYPNATDGSVLFQKTGDNAVTNTFLWDYYYTGAHSQEDKNSDIYQKYYSKSRNYVNYPMLTNGTPYLIGLPGTTFYEFDLSGEWEATTTHDTKPGKLDKQTITFASVPGATIQRSDSEMGGDIATYSSKNYNFKPNYLNNPDVETDKHAFLLNADGDSYVETAATPVLEAFRPYFVGPLTTSGAREATRSIFFSGNEEAIGSHEANEANETGTLSIHAGKHKIIVTSSLKFTTDVRILNTAGLTMKTFAIRPGETIETRILNAGVYIVQDEEGKYTKKLSVK
jgi:hypothetical protein